MPLTTSVQGGTRADLAKAIRSLIQATGKRIDRSQARCSVGGLEMAMPSGVPFNPPLAIESRLRRRGHTSEQARTMARPSVGGLELAGPSNGALLERILGRNTLMPVGFLEAGARASRSVARVHIRDEAGTVLGYGSGFLIAPRLLITNNHVLPDAEAASACLVEFDYQRDANGVIAASSFFEVDVKTLFLTSPVDELDFTLVALSTRGTRGRDIDQYGHLPLTATEGEVLAGECVSIIQHPLGEPKQVALRENEVLRLPGVEDRFLHYRTGTQPGSSGSPVFNDSWEVIALHHSGKPAVDERGRTLTTDGRIWSPEMSIDRVRWVANEGVRVAALATHLRALSLKAAARALLAPALGLEAPPTRKAALEAIRIDPLYEDREGYSPGFLGQETPLPALSSALQKEALVRLKGTNGRPAHELPYHHFSVVMHAKRRLAILTAVNLDGNSVKRPARDPDRWSFDPRIDRRNQVGDDFYERPFDRGHLVRRLDPAWGPNALIAKRANDDTYHFTNACPQHERFNEGKDLWAGLEDYLMRFATGGRRRMTIFSGPVLEPDDPVHRGVAIPKRFWKVVVFAGGDGELKAAAFLASQADLLRPIVTEVTLSEVARTFQSTVRRVEALTGIDFGPLRAIDALPQAARLETTMSVDRPLRDYEDIRLV